MRVEPGQASDAHRRDRDATELVVALVRNIADFPRPGIAFKDISPLLNDACGFAAVVDALSMSGRGGSQLEGSDVVVDKVAGVEARGFILAAPVALALGVGFVAVRKAGKLPGTTIAESYALEYGQATLEVHADAFGPGDRVLLVDDVLATGGTLAATRALVERSGAVVAGVAVVIELRELAGRDALPDIVVRSLAVM